MKTVYQDSLWKRLQKPCVSILTMNKQCEWSGLLLNLYCLQTKMLHTKNCGSRISLGKTKTLEAFEKKTRFLPLSFRHPAENRDFAQKTSKQKREVETSGRIETSLTSLLWNGFVTEPLFSLKPLNLGC